MLEDTLASLRETARSPWQPVGTPSLVALAAFAAATAAFLVLRRPPWVPLLDGVNLVFHEAGHPLFGLLPGETLGILGGTLMQLAVPLLVAASFWGRRQAAGFAFALFWLFQNFHNIAAYMADARAQELDLVGGGEHDWAMLFGRWGWLQRDTAVAGAVALLGWLGMAAVVAWMVGRWRSGRVAR